MHAMGLFHRPSVRPSVKLIISAAIWLSDLVHNFLRGGALVNTPRLFLNCKKKFFYGT